MFENLKWFQYIIGSLPLLLFFAGGKNSGAVGSAIGGAIGSIGTIVAFSVFIQEGTETSKYIKITGIVAGSILLCLLLAKCGWDLID